MFDSEFLCQVPLSNEVKMDGNVLGPGIDAVVTDE
jgi:hypothetical protein